MSQPLNRQIVVVTGASSGIGRATAILFAEQGAQLILQGNHNIRGLMETACRVAENGVQPLCVVSNFQSRDSALGCVAASFARYGKVDVWVHAAGADVLTGHAARATFDDKLERLWQVDVLAAVRICREVAVRMKNQTIETSRALEATLPELGLVLPVILTVGWDQAESGMEGDSGLLFSPIKAAVAAFSKSLAKTFGPWVRVNCLAPGWIQTAWGEQASAEWDRRARGESILGRWGQPHDVAAAAVWLASPGASFVNGQTLSINGGWKPHTA